MNYGTCWRCGRLIRSPGNNYQCSSGAWVLNGTAGEAIAQFNFVLASKNTTEAQKKQASIEAVSHGFSLAGDSKPKKLKYACKPGTEENKLWELDYSEVARAKLKALCDNIELIRTRNQSRDFS